MVRARLIRLAETTRFIVYVTRPMIPEREQELLDEVARWKQECELLRQKLDLVLRKLFGKSSEALDPAQLELLLGEPPGKAPAFPPCGDAPEEANESSVARAERKPRRERIPDHLPVLEEVLLPEPVKACPEAWRRIGEEKCDSLDYQPGKVFIRRLVRPVFVKIADRDAAPVTAKLPPRLQDGLTAAPGLIAHVLVSKYCDHLPFYRQEKILATRHGVDIGRNTMCRWAELAAFWLKPLYLRIHDGLLQGSYLQADETPIGISLPAPARRDKAICGRYTAPAVMCSSSGTPAGAVPAWVSCWAVSAGSSNATAIQPTARMSQITRASRWPRVGRTHGASFMKLYRPDRSLPPVR